jgi:hypothetical protein
MTTTIDYERLASEVVRHAAPVVVRHQAVLVDLVRAAAPQLSRLQAGNGQERAAVGSQEQAGQ